MKILSLLPILFFVATVAHAQKPAYVAYDGARLYADADYLSRVIDTLAIGDTVLSLERMKRFVHVRAGALEGWILAANLSDRAPVIVPKRAGDSARTSEARSSRTKASAPDATIEHPKSDEPSRQCAGVTKEGKQCSRKAGGESGYCWQHGR